MGLNGRLGRLERQIVPRPSAPAIVILRHQGDIYADEVSGEQFDEAEFARRFPSQGKGSSAWAPPISFIVVEGCEGAEL